MSQWGDRAVFKLEGKGDNAVLATVTAIPLIRSVTFQGFGETSRVIDIEVLDGTGDKNDQAGLLADAKQEYVGRSYGHWLSKIDRDRIQDLGSTT